MCVSSLSDFRTLCSAQLCRAPGSDKDSNIPVENDGSARTRASTDTHLPMRTLLGSHFIPPSASAAAGPGPGSAPSVLPAQAHHLSAAPGLLTFFLNYLQRCGKIVTLDTGVCVSCWQALSELASRACLAVCRHVAGCRSSGFLGGMDRRRTRWRGNRARAQARTGPPACARKHPRFACMGRLQTHSERADITGEREINLTVWRQLGSAQEKKKW